MNIQPISFGKLHIPRNEKNEKFLEMVCDDSFSRPSIELEILDKISEDENWQLQAEDPIWNRGCPRALRICIKSDNAFHGYVADSEIHPSCPSKGLKALRNSTLDHYFIFKDIPKTTPDEIFDMYA